jgi:hypothetical protein
MTMTTDLVPAGTQAMTTVEDVTENVTLVAEHPADMQIAQSRLAEWFRQKISIIKQDADDAAENLGIATKAGWKATTFERQKRVTRKRMAFYEKCLAAVEAGYTIVPNFPVDVFAIRTAKRKPKSGISESRWETFQQEAQELPIGSGRYVEPLPTVRQRSVDYKDSKTGLIESKKQYYPKDFDEEIEFPISIAKPRVMEATHRAMAGKFFDEIGCLPTRRAKKGDPIVTGAVIMRNGQYTTHRVTFLIAWWIDTRQLP